MYQQALACIFCHHSITIENSSKDNTALNILYNIKINQSQNIRFHLKNLLLFELIFSENLNLQGVSKNVYKKMHKNYDNKINL